MRRARLLVAVAALVASGAIVAVACGGRELDPNAPEGGWLDDAGAYHLPDGRVLAPGAGCVGFEAAAWAADVDPKDWGSVAAHPCDADTDCAFLPEGYPFGQSGCVFWADATPRCGVGLGPAQDIIPCNLGSAGDAYCAAVFQQFVSVPGAVAEGRCVPCDQWGLRLATCKKGNCATGCASHGGVPLARALFVRRGDGASNCENPCQQ